MLTGVSTLTVSGVFIAANGQRVSLDDVITIEGGTTTHPVRVRSLADLSFLIEKGYVDASGIPTTVFQEMVLSLNKSHPSIYQNSVLNVQGIDAVRVPSLYRCPTVYSQSLTHLISDTTDEEITI